MQLNWAFSALPGLQQYWEGRPREGDHIKDATSAIVEQYSGPEFAEIKKKLETPKESNSELKDTFLLFTKVTDDKSELIQRAIEGIKD